MVAVYSSVPNIAGIVQGLEDRNYLQHQTRRRRASRLTSHDILNDAPEDPSPGSGQRSASNSLLHRFVRAENAKLFGNPLMKRVLQFKWERYARRLFLRELAVFSVFLFVFLLFCFLLVRLPLGGDFSELTKNGTGILSILLCPILIGLSLRLLHREAQQINKQSGPLLTRLLTHVQDGWSMIQISSAILVSTACALHLGRVEYARSVTAVAALFLWYLVLYFLRAFEFTGALVRMIMQVFVLALPYMFILMIAIFGVTNTFYLLFSTIDGTDEGYTFHNHDRFYDTLFGIYTTFVLTQMDASIPSLNNGRSVLLMKLIFVGTTLVLSIFMWVRWRWSRLCWVA